MEQTDTGMINQRFLLFMRCVLTARVYSIDVTASIQLILHNNDIYISSQESKKLASKMSALMAKQQDIVDSMERNLPSKMRRKLGKELAEVGKKLQYISKVRCRSFVPFILIFLC